MRRNSVFDRARVSTVDIHRKVKILARARVLHDDELANKALVSLQKEPILCSSANHNVDSGACDCRDLVQQLSKADRSDLVGFLNLQVQAVGASFR